MKENPKQPSGQPLLPGPVPAGNLVPYQWGTLAAEPGMAKPTGAALDPRMVLNAIRRHWHVVFPLGVILATLAAAVVWITWEPEYRAEAWLEIRDRPEAILRGNAEAQSNKFIPTQIELMRSVLILNKVLSMPEVAQIPDIQRQTREEALRWVQKRLEVKSVNGSELFTVSFKGPNGKDVAIIANAIVNAYSNFRLGETNERRRALRVALDELRVRHEQEVKTAQAGIRSLAEGATGESLPLTSKTASLDSLTSPLSSLFQGQVELEVELEVLQATQKVYSETPANPEPIPAAILDEAVAGHPDIVELNAQIDLHKQNQGRVRAGSTHHQRLSEDLSKAEELLAQRAMELRPAFEKQLRDAMDRERRIYAVGLQEEIDRLLHEKEHLGKRIDTERTKMKLLAGKSFELEFKQEDLLRKQAVHRQIVDRLTYDEIENRAQDRVIPREPAVAQSIPIESTPFKLLSLAAMAAFAMPFAACVLIERIRQPISGPECLTQNCQQHVIAEIATLPTRPLMSALAGSSRYRRHRAIFEDSVDSLRTALAISDRTNQVQALVVASAVSGEGKSNLASQLAVSWARCGTDPILVVDADLRDPDLHNLFGVEAGPGLGEVLAGTAELEDVIIRDWGENIHILPAGELHENPHRAFSDARFANLLDRLRAEYKLIIIDVAPVLPASESLVISKAVDGVLVCALRDVSRGPQVRMAIERLRRGGANVLGTVLAGTPVQHYAYRYGNYAN
jgi:succinoglycan biosynthesis transport protein ExoP